MMKSFLLFFLFSIMSIAMQAQDRTVEMADTMRSNGKIYVVVAVVITIFTGIILYLIRLDRKISRLEKNTNSSI